MSLGVVLLLPENICCIDGKHGRSDNAAMTPVSKEYIFYAAAMTAALLSEIATMYGIEMLTMLPLLLAVALVGFWAFDVK
jgi:hypothetical protein